MSLRPLFFALLLSSQAASTLFAQSGFLLEPTNTLTAAVEDDTLFSTGAWSPSAPTAGGAGTVLHLDIDILTTANNSRPNIENDFTPTVYELTGLLLDVNDRSAAFDPTLLRPAGKSLRFVADGPTMPRLERFNLGAWDIDSPIELANDLTIFQGRRPNSLDLLGPITGAGGLTVEGVDLRDRINLTATTVLRAPASYTGPTLIRGNGFVVSDSPTGSGSLTGTSSITLVPGGLFGVDTGHAVGPALDLIDDDIPLTLAGGTLYSTIQDSADTETLGDLTLAGGTASHLTVRLANGGIAINNLIRERHAMLAVYGNSDIRGVGGVVAEQRVQVANPPTLVGGGGAAGTTNISIVPYMAGGSDQFGNTLESIPSAFVTVDANNNLRVLNSDTEMATNLTPGTVTAQNVSQVSSTTITAPTTINAWSLQGYRTIDGDAGLTVNSGVIVTHGGLGYYLPTDQTTLTVPEITLPNDGHLWTGVNLFLYSQLTVTGDLNKGGIGSLTLFDTATVSGGTALAEGLTEIYGALDSAHHVIVGPGARLDLLPGGSLSTSLLDLSAEDAQFRMTGGALMVDSVLGDLVIEGGVFTPLSGSEAVSSVDGDLQLSGGALALEVAEPSGGESGVLSIAGDLLLAGKLSLGLADGFTPSAGQEFLIAKIDGHRSGEFTGLSEGDIAGSIGGVDLRISYTRGDGNDIALMALAIPEPDAWLLAVLLAWVLFLRRSAALVRGIGGAMVLLAMCQSPRASAQDVYQLEPTHVVAPPSGGASTFSSLSWSPSAPLLGGPGTVLHLDMGPYVSGGSPIVQNDFSPTTYELSGLLLDYNESSDFRVARLTRPTESSWRFVASGGQDPRIEVTKLGSWMIEDPVEVVDDLTIYSPVGFGNVYFSGDISGAGGLTFVGHENPGTLTSGNPFRLSGVVSHTGPTVIRDKGVSIEAGGFTNTSSITVEAGATLGLWYSGAGDAIADTIPVFLNGGLITRRLTGSTLTETLGSVTLGRATANHIGIGLSDGALQINQLHRQRHAALAIYGDDPIRGVGGVVSGGDRIIIGNPPSTVGGGGAAGTTEISVVPYMAGHSGQQGIPNSLDPNSLVTLDVNNSLRVLDRSTELQTNLTPDTLTSTNVRQTSDVTLLAPTSVNALVLEGSRIITGSTSLAINSGVLIGAHSNNSGSVGTLAVSNLLFPNDAYLWTPDRVQAFSDVTVTGDLNKQGQGLLDLYGPVTIGGGAAFTEGETNLYGDLDATDHVIVGGTGDLELFSGGSITTPLLEVTGDKAEFVMRGGVLTTEAIVGDLRIDGGAFAPSGAVTTSIDGSLYLMSGSKVAIDLLGAAAGEHDQLDIAGDLFLAAEFDLNVVGYTPALGEEVLFAQVDGALTGQFAGLTEGAVAGSAGGLDLVIRYTAGDGNDLALMATSGLPGDYNNDGSVDAADYTVWRDNEGAAAGSLLNDTDGGVIGAAHYATWVNHFGETLGLGSAVAGTPAPEPSTIVLLSLWGLTRPVRRRVG